MKKYIPKNLSLIKASLASSIALLSASAFALSPLAYPLWTVEGGKLLDPNGNPFIFRGVTIDHSLAPGKTVQALKDVAALGANSAQIELPIKPDGSPFPRPIANQLREIVKACKDSKLVCVLEANDAAGYFEVEGGLGPDVVAEFWGWPDIREALNGAQGHIVIGISNQPLAPIFGAENYIERMRYAISIIKNAYPLFAVMVDGSNWGQDTNKAMHTLAAQNLQSTSVYQDVIYSVEMFDQYVNPEQVRDYIASFSEIGAPLVVGGFGLVPYYHPHFNGPLPLNAPRLPAESVMQYAEQYGAGYFGWSWSGNQNPALDLANNWDVNNLTGWGNLLFNGANGIKSTAKPASIFVNSSSSSSSSSSIANQNPIAVLEGGVQQVRCGYVNAELSAANSSDPDGDTLTYEWEVYNPYSSTNSYFSGPTLTYGMRPVTNYRFTVTVRDGKGGVSTATKTLSHSYSDNCIGSSSSSSIIRSSSSSIRPSSSSVPSSVSSSSIRPSSPSSSSRSSSSSLAPTAICSYVVNSQWQNGFTAAIRIKNTGVRAINRWSINWQYTDGSKVTNLWNAQLWDSGIPGSYAAGNLDWNAMIQPGQTVEFGFQGTKPASAAQVPVVRGSPCL